VPLPTRQFATNDQFQETWDNIHNIISLEHARHLVDDAAQEVAKNIRGRKVGYAWSGGKDSQALRVVMTHVAPMPAVLAVADDFEFPAFLQWVEQHAPPALKVVKTNTTWEWLKKNPHMLFPNDTALTGRWFKKVQHTGQETFFHDEGLDMLMLGRRKSDGNFVDKGDGTGVYSNKAGITYYSPIRHWTHEDVLGVCYHYNMPLPPFYDWENGWRNGTGPWPAREDTGSTHNGWRIVHDIDPTIVHDAAAHFASAQDFLDTL
jgi:3'-phosphoadenosine 5'-phosphosulfate sulfotransferase (PAPS reductase)/FAD synthetase